MANIKIKRSSVEGKIPATTDLELGELAINTYDGKLFLKRNNGVSDYIVEVAGNHGFDVKNQTGNTITKGTLVQFAGTLGSSGKILISPFLANGTTPSDYFMGVVLDDIPTGGDGFVVDHGKIYNLNTSAYADGTVLYASATVSGGFTSVQPQAPNNKITVAAVVHSSATSGIIEVRVTLGSQLGRDELVELSGLTAGNTIAYNATTARFENTALKTVNGTSLLGSGNIVISGGGGGTEALQTRYSYIATASQTTFSAEYTSPYVDVYYNGVRLIYGTDYTATNGTSVVLAVAATADDSVEIIAYNTSSVIAEAKFAKVASNLSDLSDISAARSNLGLGSVATLSAPSGTLVGTTDTQTLTNKTLDAPILLLGGNSGTAGQVPISQGTGLPPVWGNVAADLPEVKTPINIFPASGASGISDTPLLVGSAFYTLYGTPKVASQWQVSTTSDFTTTVVNTGDVLDTDTSYTVAVGILTVSTTYYWRVRYKDSNGIYSEWSAPTTFITKSSFSPTPGGPTTIGQAYGGGFYAGKILQGGIMYYLVVSPAASGQSTAKAWKFTNDSSPQQTITLNNGPSASAAIDSSSYPAAQFCEALTIGGYTDWYLPSRDELELLYRNFKPTGATNNSTGLRSFSLYVYPENTDTSSDTHGLNRSSYPETSGYTSTVPAISSTQLGFSSSQYYWSSSESTFGGAWMQSFYNGTQLIENKTVTAYVRAVRRVAV